MQERILRQQVVRAWLAPLLLGSLTTPSTPLSETHVVRTRKAHLTDAQWHLREAQAKLEHWPDHVARPGPDCDVPVELTIALAQGFKFAANRRCLNRYSQAASRVYLADRAEDLLHATDF